MNKKMKIIPIFVPHIGCPNDCVFCNQRRITGQSNVVANKEYVHNIVEKYIKTIDSDTYTEIAFFGGSFTAIDIRVQEELLSVAKYYKDLKIVNSIRCSTRPDAINDNILELQKKYGMDIIELGIQSLDDEVLKLSNRGHTRKHSIEASGLIKENGFTLGHQIMPGLPGSNREKDIKTCIESISMQPDVVRIYPTLTIKDTQLFDMYENGTYKPLTLEEAVEITAHIYSLYVINNINVIRIGLQNTDSINKDEDVKAGPFHPAFRQLVEESIYYFALFSKLSKMNLVNKSIEICAPDNLISNLAGQKKANIKQLKKELYIKQISFKKNNHDIIEIYENNNKLCSFHKSEIFQNYLNMQ
ncbi:MAG TPA: radical SAM protein [Sedimentibacter sp.]|nr:radical SAM protein [Sedimentibacter sp.]